MRRYLIFSAMLLTACERPQPPVFVAPVVSKELVTPCAAPVKGARTEGAFVEYAIGWKATARCNADKLVSLGKLIGPQ